MKKCIAAILFGVLVFGASGALAATCYVSNSGSDSYDGTEQAHTTGITGPWQTIAKVNASTFQPGDQVLFQCGGVWREQLTVPSSGSAGSPITFGSYGSGAMPTINGAVPITSWSSSWVGNLAVSQALSSGPLTGAWGMRYTINANTFSNSGGTVTITLVSSSSASTTVSGAYIGQKAASGDAWGFQTGTVAQFKFSGSTSVTIPANGSVTSDPLTYAYTKTNAYILSIGYSSASVLYGATTNYGTTYGLSGDNANAGTLDPSGYSGMGYTWHGLQAVTLVGAGPSSQANTWEAPAPAQVYRVNFNGNPGTAVSALSAVTAPGDFYWNGGQLFVYGTANPSALYADIEASQLSYGIIDTTARNYITVSGLHVTDENLRGISAAGNNWLIENCLVDYTGNGQAGYGHGVLLAGNNSTVTNSTFNYINDFGAAATGTGDSIVHNVFSNCWDGLTYAQSGAGQAIALDGASGEALGNFINNSYHCITDSAASDSLIAYNLCVTWGTNGIDHEQGVSGHPAKIYNNTIIHTDASGWGSGHGIVCQNSGSYADIRNNIVVVNGTQTNTNYEAIAFDATSTAGITLNDNDYFLAPGTTGTIGEWGATQYPTLSAWQAAVSGLVTGNDSQSISADPKLSNSTYLQPADFALQPNTPAVNAGVHLGLTNDFWGNPIEGAPDLGAIEYQFMANPGLLWW